MTLRFGLYILLFLQIVIHVYGFVCPGKQQNDDFITFLDTSQPVGINIFSHYDPVTGTVPDARGNGYDVTVRNPVNLVREMFDNNLVVHFTFDDSGSGFDNAVEGGLVAILGIAGDKPVVTPGRVGVGYTPMGYKLYDPTPLFALQFTVAAWMRFDNNQPYLFLGDIMDVRLRASGIRIFYQAPDNNDWWVEGGGPFETDTWYHVTCVVDLSTTSPATTVYHG